MIQFSRTLAIGRKDMESYYTKPPLVTWALLFPAVLMLAVFVKDPAGYLKVAPGIIAMTLLFGCTSMAAIVITFEKRSKTLRRLLLTPVSNETILAGKAGSASVYGLATTVVLTLGLLLIPGLPMAHPGWFILGLVLGAGVFSLLGIWASVMVQEVFEAMTLMNFFRFPTLFISGVFMPLASFPGWLLPLAMVSPLTYVTGLLRYGISGETWFTNPLAPTAVLAAFLAASWIITLKSFEKRSTR